MIEIITTRLKQGHRTTKFPLESPALPERYRGRPNVDPSKCASGCQQCVDACPTGAITVENGPTLDLGKCLFCTACGEACPQGAITQSQDYRLAVCHREDLHFKGGELQLAGKMRDELFEFLGRALRLRVVSAGGCNACEDDVNVLNTVGWDLSRFGIQYVASPRHADGLLITGPVTENMKFALEKTYEAVPAPKLVIALGACAISGGPYRDNPEVHNGAQSVVPVDLYVPGCPPHPLTILDGLLRLIGKIKTGERALTART